MLADDALISRRDTALSSRIEDKVLMMDIDSGAYYELDATGARIWELLEQPMPFSAICGALSEAYEVDAETCRAEAAVFVDELRQLGLVAVA
jgi:hypothetical protein